jgi:hypothetical protein
MSVGVPWPAQPSSACLGPSGREVGGQLLSPRSRLQTSRSAPSPPRPIPITWLTSCHWLSVTSARCTAYPATLVARSSRDSAWLTTGPHGFPAP